MGTGEIGVPCLRSLLASGHDIRGLVTQPDRPVGRHQALTPPQPKLVAMEAGLPVLQPEQLRDPGEAESIRALGAELVVVVAYGQILPLEILEAPVAGCINVHASLLPRHRGAACIQAAIVAGDSESGITVMHMAEGLDTGDIILRRAVPIAPDETGGSLHDRLAVLAPEVLLEAVGLLASGEAPRHAQDEAKATYAPKLERREGQIDWRRPAQELERRVRAYDPWPGTFTWFADGRGRQRRLKILPAAALATGVGEPGEVLGSSGEGLLVACGEKALLLQEVQPDGGRRMAAAEFLAGQRLPPGARFFSLEMRDD